MAKIYPTMQEAVSWVLETAKKNGNNPNAKFVCPKCGAVAELTWAGYWTKTLGARCLGEGDWSAGFKNSCGWEQGNISQDTRTLKGGMAQVRANMRDTNTERRKGGRGSGAGMLESWHDGSDR